jgi:hypothetical protein
MIFLKLPVGASIESNLCASSYARSPKPFSQGVLTGKSAYYQAITVLGQGTSSGLPWRMVF